MEPERRGVATDATTRISYLELAGREPTVVLLHGLAGSATELVPTARALGERRVLLVDQRGHGQSTRRPDDVSRSAYVRDCVAVIEAVCPGAVVLVGQSMGAHTAMLVAAARPDLVERLVLLEGNEGGGDPADADRLGRFLRSWPVPFTSRAAAREHLGDGPLERAWVDDLEQRADGFHPRFDPDVMVETMRGLQAPRLEDWRRVSVPTLVVYGGRGMFGEDEKRRFTAAGQDVTRVDLPGASHDAHLDAFDDWSRVLRAFVESG